jgi:hypothetical protein
MIMTQPSERLWWWKIAQHLDEAQLSLINAVALNTDDPAPLIALQDRMREAQTVLFYIFRAKGLMPVFNNNGAAEASKTRPAPAPVHAAPPSGAPMPPPPVAPPGAPMPMPPPPSTTSSAFDMEMPPPPAASAAGWVPDEAALGAWMPSPPLAEEPVEEPSVPGQNGVAIQPEVSAPSPTADPNPEV